MSKKYPYDVSICMPAHRTDLWERLYETAEKAVGDYSWQMILVGPNEPSEFFSNKTNFKYVKDYGTPTRCAQIATTLAEGEFMMWGSDDGYFLENSIKDCVDLHKTLKTEDVICVRYSEGANHSGEMPPDDYWKAWTHPDQRLPGIPQDYICAPVGMYKTKFFRWLGGWDCRFEHLNMCCHDLAFRAQRKGGKVHLSPGLVMSCDWNPGTGDHVPVQEAYHANDAPLFTSIYCTDQSDRIQIPYFNWQDSDRVWKRRFGDLK
jgi:hypothetical protein